MHGTNFSIYVVLHHLAREILLHWHGSSVGRKYAVEGMEHIPFYFYLKLINKINCRSFEDKASSNTPNLYSFSLS